jgi:hypothetical protein
MARERGRRRGVKWLFGLIIVLALLWSGVWYLAGRAAHAGVDWLAAAVSARGGNLTWDEQAIGGFPLTLDFHSSGLKFAYPAASLAGALNQLTARAPLYYPGRVTADFVSPLEFNAPDNGLAVTAAWSAASMTADAGLSGLTRAGGSIDGFALDQTGPRLPIRRVSAKHADFLAEPAATADDYRLTAVASELSLERSDGKSYPALAAAIDVTALQFGTSLGTDPKRAIRAWAKAGGKLHVDRLTITAGSFSLTTTNGDLSLDQNGLISGKLLLAITGLDSLPELAEQVKAGSHDKVAKVVTFVSALAKPAEGGADTRQVPVNINKGIISVGFMPIPIPIPPVKL